MDMKWIFSFLFVTSVASQRCYDKDRNCAKKTGWCDVDLIKEYCAKSCKVCGGTGTGGGQVTSAPPTGGIQILDKKDACLNAHNALRRKHQNTPDLVWDDGLQKSAEKWGIKLAQDGGLKHSKGQYGENLFMAFYIAQRACEQAIQSWYDEIKLYDFNKPGYRSGVGHFTQLVWKSSTKLGVAVVQTRNSVVVVAQYTPRGNFIGTFKDNVMRLKGTGGGGIVTQAPPSGCFDKDPKWCGNTKWCSYDKVKKNCKKTCGICSGTGGGHVTNTPTVTNPTTSGTGGGHITNPPPQPDGVQIINQDDECLKAHNAHRRKHQNTPDLVWDSELAKSALNWAIKLTKQGGLQHSRGNYGENLYMSGGYSVKNICTHAIQSWYNEIKYYNFNRPGYTRGVGHFTQLVWKSSTKLGMAIAKKGRRIYIVAQYSPSGNWRNKFAENVMRLI